MDQQKTLILIVDDTAENRDILARRVEQMGHATVSATNGREALEVMRSTPVDLVLLDIMMPEMSGHEVLQHMRQDESLKHIPVIVVSALSDLESVVRCIELGAEDYLFKPFNTTLLRARVGASIEKKLLHDRELAYVAELQVERQKSERLLLSIFPRSIAERLKSSHGRIAESFPQASVLFADICGFAKITVGKP